MIQKEKIQSLIIEIINYIVNNKQKYNGLIVRQESNGAHTNISYTNYSFSKENLSNELITDIKSVLTDEKYTQSIIASCANIYLISILANTPPTRDQNEVICELADNEASHISSSINGGDNYAVEITFLSEIDRAIKIPSWQRQELNTIERSIRAHQSGINGSEFLSRLAHTTTYRKDLHLFKEQIDHAAIIEEAENLVLALSLSLLSPVKIDDIQIVAKDWKFTPQIPFYFQRMHGYWDESYRNSSSSNFFSKTLFANKDLPPSFQNEKIKVWLDLLDRVGGAKYPFSLIMRGVWGSFSTSNLPQFQKESKALDAITDILLGMEGLIRKSNTDFANVKKFTTAWTKIINNYEKFNAKTKAPKKLAKLLYDLRCVLAHGGVDLIPERLKQAKIALGDNFNEGSYNATDVALNLSRWLLHTLNAFDQNPHLLVELYPTESAIKETSLIQIWNRLIESLLID